MDCWVKKEIKHTHQQYQQYQRWQRLNNPADLIDLLDEEVIFAETEEDARQQALNLLPQNLPGYSRATSTYNYQTGTSFIIAYYFKPDNDKCTLADLKHAARILGTVQLPVHVTEQIYNKIHGKSYPKQSSKYHVIGDFVFEGDFDSTYSDRNRNKWSEYFIRYSPEEAQKVKRQQTQKKKLYRYSRNALSKYAKWLSEVFVQVTVSKHLTVKRLKYKVRRDSHSIWIGYMEKEECMSQILHTVKCARKSGVVKKMKFALAETANMYADADFKKFKLKDRIVSNQCKEYEKKIKTELKAEQLLSQFKKFVYMYKTKG